MGLVTRTLTASLLGLTLASCAGHDTYPPALPAGRVLWDNSPFVAVTPPPAELQWSSPTPQAVRTTSPVPSRDEWAQWRAYRSPQTVCVGKGKQRRCRTVQPSTIDQANATAVVKPTAVHTAYGQSVRVTYPYDRRGGKVYEIHTSPGEFTRLLLPIEERLAAKLALDPQAWEVSYGKTGAEGSRQELIAVRPMQAPQKGRDMLLLQSGLPIYLQFVTTERPGMLSVAWEMPQLPKEPAPRPLDQRPPIFDTSHAYAGYTVTLDGKGSLTPPWMPKTAADDGKNTLVHFGSTLEGQRMPTVVGIQQNGKPAIVASRLYTRPDRPEEGAWLYIQGLWPSLSLRDSAGLTVKIVRQVPTQGATHAQR